MIGISAVLQDRKSDDAVVQTSFDAGKIELDGELGSNSDCLAWESDASDECTCNLSSSMSLDDTTTTTLSSQINSYSSRGTRQCDKSFVVSSL